MNELAIGPWKSRAGVCSRERLAPHVIPSEGRQPEVEGSQDCNAIPQFELVLCSSEILRLASLAQDDTQGRLVLPLNATPIASSTDA